MEMRFAVKCNRLDRLTMNPLRTLSSCVARIALLLTLTLILVPSVPRIIPAAAQTYGVLQGNFESRNFSNSSGVARTWAFGVIGSAQEEPAIRNFYWLLGNQSISYDAVLSSEITASTDLDSFAGLIVWTKQGGYNASAIREFAQTHIVIAHTRDFCNILYPGLSRDMQVVNNGTVVYDVDWGNFRRGDVAEMRNETGNSNQLTSVLTTSLKGFSNITTISQFDSSRTASFFMNGTQRKSGFYVMDLDATTPSTEFTGIWHVFPAVKMVQDFPTGEYARWMANGQNWWDLNWVYNSIDALVTKNTDIAKKAIIGHSVQDRDIVAIFVGHGTSNAIMDGAIHGNEKTGTFACLRTAELLINYYRSDSYWKKALSEYMVIIVPVLNPDGFAANSRYNAHGADLNSQFPPDGTPTQPEARALMNLMGNYTPSVYINMHEGYYWYPLEMLYGNYESGNGKTETIADMFKANETFVNLQHWGWFTEEGSDVWIGKVNTIAQGRKIGMAISYASYQYHASCMLLETFVWSDKWGARQCLWGLDYYASVSIAFLEQHVNVTIRIYDLNGDGRIDGRDISIVAKAYGTFPGDPLWNAIADVDRDGKVDGKDIALVAINYGKVP
jgi:hypothetical protein